MDGTTPGLCPMVGFGISATEPESYFSLLFSINIITSTAGSCEHSKEP
jgi:hypothetical protein